jgi:C-terminal processing protease CtpA/Prc
MTAVRFLAAAALAALSAGALAGFAQHAPTAAAHDYYPLGVGDSWTYQSSFRGEFTNLVTDTSRLDGVLWYSVTSTDERGLVQQLQVRHAAGRVLQRAGTGPEQVIADFTAPVGESVAVTQGTAPVTVTYTAHHDTVTVLGTTYRDVRQYRHAMGGGTGWDAYFARGIGLVAMVWPNAEQQVRLVRAEVAGVPFMAAAPDVPGSGIGTQPLSPVQVESLALLARVWGFVKYHHPAVAGGSVDWDAELFRIMPQLLHDADAGSAGGGVSAAAAGSAADAGSAAHRIALWLSELGEPDTCDPCAVLATDVHLAPDIEWIRDVAMLGEDLSGRLVRIHRNRSTAAAQRYVSHAPGVGNPLFSGEASYAALAAPDAGYRLLALFRYWNIIAYWFPYRDLLEDDWEAVLREFIPHVMAAEGTDAYRLAMLRLIGRIHDTHATLPLAAHLRPPAGPARLPVVTRFVDGSAVVTGYSHPVLGPATGLLPGDVVLGMDGASVDSLVAAWAPFYPASNEAARLRDMARTLTQGGAGAVRLLVRREGAPLELVAERVPVDRLDPRAGETHDLPGETFRMLSDDVAYLKLSAIEASALNDYFRRAADARVLVIDLRNYPSQFVVFPLGGRFVAERTPFALFTTGDPRNPGAFRWTGPVALQPVAPRHSGAVVVLVDETTLSQAEYTAMALQAAPSTIVVGSTTAAADGNVSSIPLPGGLITTITGIGVFYPDRTPTQRIGIALDLAVRPTVAGLREGRDEVLEAGVSRALGREFRLPRR